MMPDVYFKDHATDRFCGEAYRIRGLIPFENEIADIYVCVYVYIYIQMHMNIHVHVQVHVYICVYTYAYINAYIHTYT